MNLIFVWVEHYKCFNEKFIRLNHNYNIKMTYRLNSKIEFEIERISENHFSLYNEKRVEDMYIVLGKNGAGKTTLIELLGHHILKDASYIFVLEENEEIKVLFSKDWVEDFKCSIKFIYKDKLKFYVFKKESSLKKLYTASVKYNKGALKYVANKHYDILEKFNDVDELTIFDFVIREKKFLNFEKDKQLELVLNVEFDYADLDERLYDFSNMIIQSINSGSRDLITVYGYIFLLFIFKNSFVDIQDIVSPIISKHMNPECFKNIDLFKEFILKVAKELDDLLKEKSTLWFDKFSYFNWFKDLYFHIVDFDFLYIQNNKICFKISDITDLNMENFRKFIIFITKYLPGPILKNLSYFKVETSTGENAYIRLLASIYSVIEYFNRNDERINDRIDEKLCLLGLDEIEQNLHPEWCRQLISKLFALINEKAMKHKYLIYMSTHSPYVISDFTSDHIINLDNTKGMDFNSFGANINDILLNGMFLDNPMGEYALSMIRGIFSLLSNKKIKRNEMLIEIGKILNENFSDNIKKSEVIRITNKLNYFIDCIGEPLIRIQMRTLYEKKFGCDKDTILISKNAYDETNSKEELLDLLKKQYNIKIK